MVNKSEIRVMPVGKDGKNHVLTIDVKNSGVSLLTGGFIKDAGNYTSIFIFDLTPEDIVNIGQSIKERGEELLQAKEG